MHTPFRSAFTLALALAGTLAALPAAAASITINYNGCNALGGTWSLPGPTCILSNLSVPTGDVVTVPSPNQLKLNGSSVNRGSIEVEPGAYLYLSAGGSLENRGSVMVEGEFTNDGDVDNRAGGGVSVEDGSLLNNGNILNSEASTYLSNSGGLINNYGVLENNDTTAYISNTHGYLKNRGGTIDVGTGILTNDDQGTVTNVNAGRIEIGDDGEFINQDGSLLLNRANGDVVNNGTFINVDYARIENHGRFDNHWLLDNSYGAVLTNEEDALFTNSRYIRNYRDGEIENLGDFGTNLGYFDNACDGSLTNFASGHLDGAFHNWGGTADNLGYWWPGPVLDVCDYTPW